MGIFELKIRIEMLKRGLTGGRIARQLGVDRSTINKTIKGRLKSHRLRKAIAQALEMRTEDVWPGENGQ